MNIHCGPSHIRVFFSSKKLILMNFRLRIKVIEKKFELRFWYFIYKGIQASNGISRVPVMGPHIRLIFFQDKVLRVPDMDSHLVNVQVSQYPSIDTGAKGVRYVESFLLFLLRSFRHELLLDTCIYGYFTILGATDVCYVECRGMWFCVVVAKSDDQRTTWLIWVALISM